jgi:hypothetical protein
MGGVQGGQLQQGIPVDAQFTDARLAADDFQSFDDVCGMPQGTPEQGLGRFHLASQPR